MSCVRKAFWKQLYGMVLCTLLLPVSVNGQSAPKNQAAASLKVAVLGDSTSAQFLSKLASAFKTPVQTVGNRITTKIPFQGKTLQLSANTKHDAQLASALSYESDFVVIASDATEGPRPIDRENILIARQMDVPCIAVAFINSGAISDPQLLELEEMELRETLNKYELKGDTALVLYDERAPKTKFRQSVKAGSQQIVDALGRSATNRKPSKMIQRKQLEASVYALVPQEVFRKDLALGVRPGKVSAVIAGEPVLAEVVSGQVKPGANERIKLVLSSSIKMAKYQRFLLVREGHVIAVGFSTD